jgi:hypothetical protein
MSIWGHYRNGFLFSFLKKKKNWSGVVADVVIDVVEGSI